MLERTVYSTTARRRIGALLKAERRYLTATDIHHALRAQGARLALSTVYRTLEMLTQSGVVSSRAAVSGEQSFVYCDEGNHHHHAICRGCDRVEEVDCAAIDVFRKALLEQQAFDLDEHAIEFTGICARCREAQSHARP
jgi:Fur family transcriptional regulator, ferric uptake regulator